MNCLQLRVMISGRMIHIASFQFQVCSASLLNALTWSASTCVCMQRALKLLHPGLLHSLNVPEYQLEGLSGVFVLIYQSVGRSIMQPKFFLVKGLRVTGLARLRWGCQIFY